MGSRLVVVAIVVAACGGGGGGNNNTPHDVTVTVQGPGHVSSTPTGIDCPSACSDTFTDHVTLYAQPDNGATFVGWSGSCSGTDPSCALGLSGDATATAMFAPAGDQTLTVTVTGPGSVAGMNLDCPGTNCMQSYAPGTMVTLTASPDTSATFTGWSGDCSGTGDCTVTMDRARSVNATFTGPPGMHMLSVIVTGPGTVTSTPAGISCSSGTCTAMFNDTDTVVLAATPTGAGTFSSWSGYCSGNGSCSVPMTADRSVSATFASSGYVLTVQLGGDGTGTVVSNPAGINCSNSNPAGCSYDFGPSAGSVTLTATADTDSSFAGMGIGSPGGCMGDNYASSCSYGLNSSGVTVGVWFSAWKGRYAFPATMTGLVLANGAYVAVGTGGNAATSTNDAAGGNGTYWTGHDAPAGLEALTYQGGLYLAARDGGHVAASPDGVTWIDYAAGTTDLLGITSSGSMAVAVGKAGSVQYSANGVTWTASTAITAYDLEDVAYGNGAFVAVGYGGTILSSSDGISWTARTSGVTSVLYGVTYGVSQFVAVGAGGVVLTSPDGATWTKPTTSGLPVAALRGIAASGTHYVAAGDPYDSMTTGTTYAYTSLDAVTWVAHTSATWNEPTLRVVYPGDGNFYMLGSSGSIARSSTGSTWTPVLAPGGRSAPGQGQSNMLAAIAYSGTLWVAGGQWGSIFTSPDGVTWTSRRAGSCCGTIAGIAYGAGVFAAVGYSGNATYILTSPDGITWTQAYPTSGSLLGYPIGIAYGGGVFSAVGAYNGTGYAITSADGVTWTPSASAGTEITGGVADLTYGGGQFVLGGYQGSPFPTGVIWTSPDGAAWTQQSVMGTSAFGPLGYGNGAYVALARNSNASYTSANGIQWTSNSVTFTAGAAMAFGNGVFYNSALFTSTDGVTWAQVSPLPNLAEINGGVFTAAIYAANKWVGVSGNELFVTHP